MLLARLIEKQRADDMSDAEFADRLGVPRSTWQLTRTGIKPLGLRVAQAAAITFPDLKALVVSFLLSGATGVASRDATEATIAS